MSRTVLAGLLVCTLCLMAAARPGGGTGAGRGTPPAPAGSGTGLRSDSNLTTFKSRFYEVSTDMPRAEVNPIVAHMDAVYQEYLRRFDGFAVKNAIAVRMYLFRTREAYTKFLDSKGVPNANSGGIFFIIDNNESGLCTFIEGQPGRRMYHVLQHEGFHQFAHIRLGETLPIWANEGLAEYFGRGILVKGVMRTGVAPQSRIDELVSAVRGKRAFDFVTLLGMDSEQWSKIVTSGDKRAALMYDQSWSIVHFLVQGDKGKYADAFVKYLKLIAQGRNHAQASDAAFGVGSLPAFEKSWRRFILEDVQPDAISTAVDRLDFFGEGIKFLASKGAKPASFEELKERLMKMGFVLTRIEEGAKTVWAANDDGIFDPPPKDDASRPTKYEWIVAKGEGLPGIRVKGLSVGVVLGWTKTASGYDSKVDFE